MIAGNNRPLEKIASIDERETKASAPSPSQLPPPWRPQSVEPVALLISCAFREDRMQSVRRFRSPQPDMSIQEQVH